MPSPRPKKHSLTNRVWGVPFMSEQRLIIPEDLKHLKSLSQIAVSPDGAYAAYVRADIDLPNNATLRNIWLAPLDGGKPVQLTRSGKDSNPVWSPDGKHLAFVSARGGKPQVYMLSLGFPGGEPRQLTKCRQRCNCADVFARWRDAGLSKPDERRRTCWRGCPVR